MLHEAQIGSNEFPAVIQTTQHDHAALVLYGEEAEPAFLDELAHAFMPGEDSVDDGVRSFDQDAQADELVHPGLGVVHALQQQAGGDEIRRGMVSVCTSLIDGGGWVHEITGSCSRAEG